MVTIGTARWRYLKQLNNQTCYYILLLKQIFLCSFYKRDLNWLLKVFNPTINILIC